MEEYIIERLKPEGAQGVVKCMLRTYGADYPSNEVYDPEKIAQMNASGSMISVVAKTPDLEIAGHYCIIIENIESRLGELGQAVVAPEHRNRGLMKKMRALLENLAAKAGLIGLYSAPVTSHTYSQQVNLSFGSRECCIDLGYVPQGVTFIDNPWGTTVSERETVVIFFKYLTAVLPLEIYVPPHHEKIIKSIYENLNIKRIFSGKASALPEKETVLRHKISPQWTCSWIGIVDYGKDFAVKVGLLERKILAEGVETIHIDLPLDNPLTPGYCKLLEDKGYLFIGIIPNFLNGADALRLQYTLQRIDFSKIKVHSDFAKKLLEYIKRKQQS